MTDTTLQYPIGKFAVPAVVTIELRDAALAEMTALPHRIADAVAGLDDAQLATPYREGGWTVRQVVHHVADSHMHAYLRVKFALTATDPVILPYDEGAWAALPDVTSVPVATSLALIEALHARWTACLRDTPAVQLTRPFVHPEMGPQPIDLSMLRYAWHGRHHVAHITSLRARMGW